MRLSLSASFRRMPLRRFIPHIEVIIPLFSLGTRDDPALGKDVVVRAENLRRVLRGSKMVRELRSRDSTSRGACQKYCACAASFPRNMHNIHAAWHRSHTEIIFVNGPLLIECAEQFHAGKCKKPSLSNLLRLSTLERTSVSPFVKVNTSPTA